MDVREYLLSLLAIITGMAITDMVVSLHGLLRRFHTVRWDWLPVTAATFVFLVIVGSWWTSWISAWEGIPFPSFVFVLFQVIALFLAAKAVLPDDKDEDRLDLMDYYTRTNRYVWIAVAAIPVFIVAQPLVALRLPMGPASFLIWAAPFLVFSVLAAVLVFVQRTRVHRILVPVLLVLILLMFGGQRLTTSIHGEPSAAPHPAANG